MHYNAETFKYSVRVNGLTQTMVSILDAIEKKKLKKGNLKRMKRKFNIIRRELVLETVERIVAPFFAVIEDEVPEMSFFF